MEEDEIQWKCDDAHCRIGLTRKVAKVFAKLDAKIRASLLRWMGHFAKEGGTNLPPERFKFERRVQIGNDAHGIFVFKEWQTRLYGGYLPDASPKAFLITEIDDAKKQNKADQTIFDRAAKILQQHAASARGEKKK